MITAVKTVKRLRFLYSPRLSRRQRKEQIRAEVSLDNLEESLRFTLSSLAIL